MNQTATKAAPSDHEIPVGSLTNVPNLVTLARMVLTLVCFVCLALDAYRGAFVLFLLAAGTDWVDGWWARRFNQITQIGRVLDPFADKLLICGVFVFLAAAEGSGIADWVAVVVLARELLVTALRSFVEARGGDFSAKWVGKWKMVAQCVAAALSLLILTQWWASQPELLRWGVYLSVAVTVVLTLWSGADYVRAALRMTRVQTGEATHG